MRPPIYNLDRVLSRRDREREKERGVGEGRERKYATQNADSAGFTCIAWAEFKLNFSSRSRKRKRGGKKG